MGGVDNLPPMTVVEAMWSLVHARIEWRRLGNYAEADAIRDALRQWGYEIDDLPDGRVSVRKVT